MASENYNYISGKALTSQFCKGIWGRLEKPKALFEPFMELDTYKGDKFDIYIKLAVKAQMANIVGYQDSSIYRSGDAKEETRLQPWHIKNKEKIELATDPNESPLVLTGPGPLDWKVDSDLVISKIESLETMRRNLIWNSVGMMLSNKEFKYQDGDTSITIPYHNYIADLNPAAGVDFLRELDLALLEFLDSSKQRVHCGFVSLATAIKMINKPEVRKFLDDSKQVAKLHSGVVNIYDIPFYIGDFNEWKNIPDDTVIFITEKDFDGRRPLRFNRGSNQMNQADASAPHYDVITNGNDPFSISVRLYDNFIPSIATKNNVMHWRIQ